MYLRRGAQTGQPRAGDSPVARINTPGAIFGLGYEVPFGGTISNSTAPLVAGSGVGGLAWTNDGSSQNGAIVTANSTVSTSSFSILAVVEFASSGSFGAILDRDLNTLRSFQLRRTTTSTIELIRFNTAVSSVISATTVGTVPINTPTAIVAVVRGLNHAVYLGKETARAAITGTPQVFDGVLGLAASWGGTSGTSGYPASPKLNGKLYAYAALPYALSEHEAQAMAQSPAAMYERLYGRRQIIVPVAAAAGGGTSLTLADASHAHAADNVVLTTATTLAVADCTHAHAVDSITLTVDSLLAVADATHSHAADNIVLVAGSVLTVADATHTHAADALALTTASTLAVAEATHAHAADNVTLSIAGATNLAVADATHAHMADALVLTSAHALIVAEATHGHTIDGLTLTAASVLAIQEALHAHAADGITLDASGAPTLLLADALHAHTADGMALTVDAWLVVADARHVHRADNVALTIPGAYIEGNPRVWLIDARRHYTAIDARNRVAHLS